MRAITFKQLTLSSPELPQMEYIYETEFPPAERVATMRQMIEAAEEKNLNIRSIWDGEKAVGFNILINREGWNYLLFFGIDKNCQGAGYGGRVMQAIAKDFEDKTLVFAIEQLDPDAPNATQRVRRKNFYLKNGMHDTGIRRNLSGCDFEMMSNKQTVSPEVAEQITAYFKTMEESMKE